MNTNKNNIETLTEPMAIFEETGKENNGTLYITKKGIGEETNKGKELLIEFLKSLLSSNIKPEHIIFCGKSISLLNEEIEVRKIMFELEEYNTEIILCRESMEKYDIKIGLKKVKELDINEITEIIFKTQKVITI